jgi:dynactin-6
MNKYSKLSLNWLIVGIEARQVGSYNTFEAKSKVTSSIIMGDYCTVGAACTLDADATASPEDLAAGFSYSTVIPADGRKEQGIKPEVQEAIPQVIREDTSTGNETAAEAANEDRFAIAGMESIPSYTVVYGRENARRKWSGEGKGQQTALVHKHLAYLTEMLPKYSRLKLFT